MAPSQLRRSKFDLMTDASLLSSPADATVSASAGRTGSFPRGGEPVVTVVADVERPAIALRLNATRGRKQCQRHCDQRFRAAQVRKYSQLGSIRRFYAGRPANNLLNDSELVYDSAGAMKICWSLREYSAQFLA